MRVQQRKDEQVDTVSYEVIMPTQNCIFIIITKLPYVCFKGDLLKYTVSITCFEIYAR